MSADTTAPLDRVVAAVKSRGGKVKGSGANLMVSCPAHADEHCSCAVKVAEDGRVLLHCHAGCKPEAVVTGWGLAMGDLFPPDTNRLNGAAGGPVQVIEHVYEIRDYEGHIVAHHHRTNLVAINGNGKPKKEMRWSTPGNPKGLGGIKVRDLPLYGTELLKTHPGTTVTITEGEKAADALRARGILALATVTGAGDKVAKAPSRTVLQVLKDREVVLWPDDDDAGRTHMLAIQVSLRGIARSVRMVEWKGPTPKCDAADFAGTDAELRDLLDIAAPVVATAAPSRTIIIDNDMEAVTNYAIAALLSSKADVLFQRAGKLVVVRAAEIRRSSQATASGPSVAAIETPHLRELFSSAAKWTSVSTTGSVTETIPPDWVAKTAMARPAWADVPVLEAVSEIPIVRADGVVVQEKGYDAGSGVLFLPPPGVEYRKVPESPSKEEVDAAVHVLRDPLCDFHWSAPEGGAAALAATLTIVARHAIHGPCPLFHFGAPTPGSGKTLLASVCAMMATGRLPSILTASADETETQKRVMSLGMAGDSVILLDNLEGSFGSPTMSAILTSPATYRDRMLGGNTMGTVPMRAVWFSNGNNTQWTGDIARRVVPIEQDPGVEKPEDRTDWVYGDLKHHVAEAHPNLVYAALVILRAHAVAGRPDCVERKMGSFEAWDRVVRSAIVWATGQDPCAGRAAVAETSDSSSQDLAQVLAAWQAAYAPMGGDGTVAGALQRCYAYIRLAKEGHGATASRADADLCDAMRVICPVGDFSPIAIGKWIAARAGRIIGGRKFVRSERKISNAVGWRVVEATP